MKVLREALEPGVQERSKQVYSSMYKHENNGQQSKNDIDQPRHKNANGGSVETFHRY